MQYIPNDEKASYTASLLGGEIYFGRKEATIRSFLAATGIWKPLDIIVAQYCGSTYLQDGCRKHR